MNFVTLSRWLKKKRLLILSCLLCNLLSFYRWPDTLKLEWLSAVISVVVETLVVFG